MTNSSWPAQRTATAPRKQILPRPFSLRRFGLQSTHSAAEPCPAFSVEPLSSPVPRPSRPRERLLCTGSRQGLRFSRSTKPRPRATMPFSPSRQAAHRRFAINGGTQRGDLVSDALRDNRTNLAAGVTSARREDAHRPGGLISQQSDSHPSSQQASAVPSTRARLARYLQAGRRCAAWSCRRQSLCPPQKLPRGSRCARCVDR